MEPILTLLLGWLLGAFTPLLADTIRRPYRRRDLMRAVIDEMLGLQYTMAMVAHRIRARYAEVSDGFLDDLLPIVEGYRGPDRSEDLARGLAESRGLSEAQRATVDPARRKPDVGISLAQYATPLFATQIADLAICGVDFQRAVLHIRKQLGLFNDLVPYTRWLMDKTFGKPSPEDREALVTNQEAAYRDAGRRAEIIMRAISELCRRYSQEVGAGKSG
ncbi:MAG: hypothetical protein ACLQVN_08430 [Bryobacteraceae bacterium]